jgi:phage protein U
MCRTWLAGQKPKTINTNYHKDSSNEVLISRVTYPTIMGSKIQLKAVRGQKRNFLFMTLVM